jgi:WD40 repeat protein
VLRAEDGKQETQLTAGGAIQSIALSPDDSLVVCGLIDGRVVLFRLASRQQLDMPPAHTDTVNAVAFHPSGRLMATASRDKTVALWSVDGESLSELLRIPSPSGHPIVSVRFSPDGQKLGMLVRNERAVRLWHLDTIRAKLRALGLDWDVEASAPVASR